MADEKDLDWGHVGMTVAETAKCLRVHERTVRDMIATRPDFPARLMGGYGGRSWRISKAALERWLDGRDIRPESEASEPATTDFREHLPEVQAMFPLKQKPEGQA